MVVVGSVTTLISGSVLAAGGQVAPQSTGSPLGASASPITSIKPVTNVRSVKFPPTLGIASPALSKTLPWPRLTRRAVRDSTQPATLAKAPVPVIVRVWFPSHPLSASGSSATVTVLMRHVKYCQLVLTNHPGLPVHFDWKSQSCSNGVFRDKITVGPNRTYQAVRVDFEFSARDDTSVAHIEVVLQVSPARRRWLRRRRSLSLRRACLRREGRPCSRTPRRGRQAAR
jgi:hypothetical protein